MQHASEPINVSSDENIQKALERLSRVRNEADQARENLDENEGKVEEALIVIDLYQRNVERESARLAFLEDEIGDIRLALLGCGILDTHH
jgi:hypothetical protein